MNRDPRPICTTVLVGGLGALAWLLADLAVGGQASRSVRFFGLLWFLTAIYARLLVRWSGGRGWPAVLFPLAVLGLWGWHRPYAGDTVVVVLAILSWVRSGICFPCAPGPAILREAAVCGGGLLAAALIPDRVLSWAVGIWLFFLVQALFFVFFENGVERGREKAVADPFERALRRAAKILDQG